MPGGEDNAGRPRLPAAVTLSAGVIARIGSSLLEGRLSRRTIEFEPGGCSKQTPVNPMSEIFWRRMAGRQNLQSWCQVDGEFHGLNTGNRLPAGAGAEPVASGCFKQSEGEARGADHLAEGNGRHSGCQLSAVCAIRVHPGPACLPGLGVPGNWDRSRGVGPEGL